MRLGWSRLEPTGTKGAAMDEFKERQRAMWAAGDYPTLAEFLVSAGELVVERGGVQPGSRVLDVACGPGTATLPAARAGGIVTGLDLSSELLDAGRRKAEAEGIDVEWVEGDAEALPFDDGAFQYVISTFGHMFAPRHRETAEEMARVTAADGVIAMCCWTPEGLSGRIFKASGAYMPPPPEYASPPVLWGTEDHVRKMFCPVAREATFERHDVTLEWDSLDGFADYFMSRFPTMVTAQRVLGDRWPDLRAEIIELWNEANEADDGSLKISQEYLLSIVRL
jgi:SAM-dependent methyltransferase